MLRVGATQNLSKKTASQNTHSLVLIQHRFAPDQAAMFCGREPHYGKCKWHSFAADSRKKSSKRWSQDPRQKVTACLWYIISIINGKISRYHPDILKHSDEYKKIGIYEKTAFLFGRTLTAAEEKENKKVTDSRPPTKSDRPFMIYYIHHKRENIKISSWYIETFR